MEASKTPVQQRLSWAWPLTWAYRTRLRSAPWYVTRSSDVFTAGRQHNRWQAASGDVGNPTRPPVHIPSSYKKHLRPAHDFRYGGVSMNEHPNAVIARSAYEAFANGDGAALAALLDEGIVWHESTPGFEGNYHGRDQALALLDRVVQEVEGIKMSPLHDVLASDDHVVVLHEWTATCNGRTLNGQYADVYHLRNGKATEHWHLAVDPKAEEAFWAS